MGTYAKQYKPKPTNVVKLKVWLQTKDKNGKYKRLFK